MKTQVVLLFGIFVVSCGLTNGNWITDIIKGVSEGIQDAYKEGKNETKLKDINEHLIKRISEHPKFKHHKANIHKVLKKAEKHLDKLHKKFEKLYKDNDAKKAKDKQLKAIKKWMSSLTKINTDGEVEHGIPFVPRILPDQNKKEKKAEHIFESLAKMWEEKSKKLVQDEKEVTKDEKPLILGKDVQFIKPMDFEKLNMFGKDAKQIIPDFVKDDFNRKEEKDATDKDELKKLHKMDEKDIMPDFVKKEFEDMRKKEMLILKKELQKKPVLGENEKYEELLGDTDEEKAEDLLKPKQVKENINKESEDLEKTVEELIPFLGKEKSKKGQESNEKVKDEKEKPAKMMLKPEKPLLTTFIDRMKVIKFNPANTKSLDQVMGEEDKTDFDEKEEEIMSTKQKFFEASQKRLKDAEETVIKVEKDFAEAEKKWEEEIKKKAAEEIQKEKEKEGKKTTEEQEVEEDLHEEADTTFTPPNDVQATKEPTVNQGAEKPLFTYDFYEQKEDSSAKYHPEDEQVFPVPREVKEPASLFVKKKRPESAFEEMSDNVKPFFQKLDDSEFREKFLSEEKQWVAIEKWAVDKLYGKKKEKFVK